MREVTRILEKGQVAIPKHLREKYGLEPGDEILWLNRDEGIVVRKLTRTSGPGMLVSDDLTEEKREGIAEKRERRVRDRRDRNYKED